MEARGFYHEFPFLLLIRWFLTRTWDASKRNSLLVQVQANLQRASSELFFMRGDHDGAWWNSIVRVVKYAASFGTREKMRDEYYLLLVAPSRWIKSIWAIFKNIFKLIKERKEFKREFLFVCFFFLFFDRYACFKCDYILTKGKRNASRPFFWKRFHGIG